MASFSLDCDIERVNKQKRFPREKRSAFPTRSPRLCNRSAGRVFPLDAPIGVSNFGSLPAANALLIRAPLLFSWINELKIFTFVFSCRLPRNFYGRWRHAQPSPYRWRGFNISLNFQSVRDFRFIRWFLCLFYCLRHEKEKKNGAECSRE